MPILDNVTTKESRSVWRAPDGQREIFELVMDYKGSRFSAKTYSKDISVIGWSGSVETYEKPGKMGAPTQTFVKQPTKEDGFTPSAGGGQKPVARNMPSDPFTMYLSYAKDITVALIAAGGDVASKKDYTDFIDQTIIGAYTLYDARPEARTKHEAAMDQQIDQLKTDPVVEPTIQDLNDILGKDE